MVSYRNGVSIGEIVAYVPLLLVAVRIAFSHGFGRSSGWYFLIIFALARIIGPCLQLATIHDPTNANLYTGAAILQSIGLSPLMLAALGLLSRAISSITKVRPTLPSPKQLRIIHIIVTVGFILGVLGGINASEKIKSTGKYVPQTTSKVSVVLFAVTYILLVMCVILTSFNIRHAEPGEKRLLLAVALSLPFLLVRLVYACIAIFDTHSTTFNLISGNVTVWLVMSLVMELIVVLIYEGVGITLQRRDFYERQDGLPTASPNGYPGAQPEGPGPYYGDGKYGTSAPPPPQGPPPYGNGAGPSKGGNILRTIGRKTIIGRIVTAAMNRGNRGDVEMQQQPRTEVPHQ